MINLALALLSLVLLCTAMVRQSSTAHAPPGWHVHGVRPDGVYELLRAPTWPEPRCTPTANACVTEEPEIWVRSRIVCTGGTRAIVVDARTVGCQR